MRQYLQDRKKQKKLQQFQEAHTRRAGRELRTGPIVSSRPEPPKALQYWKRLSQRQKNDGLAVIGTITLLLTLGWYLSFQQGYLTVDTVMVSGNQFIQSEAVQAVADDYLKTRTAKLLPRNSYWTADPKALEERIREAFASEFALEAVTVQKDFPDTLQIQLVERVPRIAWVTKGADGRERFYLVDHQGFVTQEVGSFTELDPAFPRVRDDNRPEIGLGWQIVSPAYIEFLLTVHERFTPETNLERDSYILPKIDCTRQEYVAEEILEQEIEDSASEEFRQKKIAIQEQFQSGQLTVDESIAALEQVKEEELGDSDSTEGTTTKVQWQTVAVPIECDLVKVATDLHLVTSGENGGFTVYLDSQQDLTVQLQNLVSVLDAGTVDRQAVGHIDLRIPDRVFYQ